MQPRPSRLPRRAIDPVEVLIVDDSAVVRAALGRILDDTPGMQIAGVCDGAEKAVAWLRTNRADIVLLDIQMPGIDGLTAMPALVAAANGAPILIVSSIAAAGAEATVRALALGAADTLEKPRAGQLGANFGELLVERIVKLAQHVGRRAVEREPVALRAASAESIGCVAIGASTGGIHALEAFLTNLPADFAPPILVTQHLPPAFVPFFVQQMATRTGRRVRIGSEGLAIAPQTITVAPGHAHMGCARRGTLVQITLHTHQSESRCVPSVDPMFADVASVYGARGVGVVLTGMGRDGFNGANDLVRARGTVLVQDSASATVWGMPGAVAKAGLASRIDTPAALARFISRQGS